MYTYLIINFSSSLRWRKKKKRRNRENNKRRRGKSTEGGWKWKWREEKRRSSNASFKWTSSEKEENGTTTTSTTIFVIRWNHWNEAWSVVQYRRKRKQQRQLPRTQTKARFPPTNSHPIIIVPRRTRHPMKKVRQCRQLPNVAWTVIYWHQHFVKRAILSKTC